jgi:hypothetical protein
LISNFHIFGHVIFGKAQALQVQHISTDIILTISNRSVHKRTQKIGNIHIKKDSFKIKGNRKKGAGMFLFRAY